MRQSVLAAERWKADIARVVDEELVGLGQFFFAHAASRGQDGDAVLVGDAPHPGLVGIGALLKDGRLDAGDADDIVEEVDQVFWTLQPLDVAVRDDLTTGALRPEVPGDTAPRPRA